MVCVPAYVVEQVRSGGGQMDRVDELTVIKR